MEFDDLIPVVPEYLTEDQEENLETDQEPEEDLEEESEEDLEQTSIDYTSYLETLVSNQEDLLLYTESLELKIDDLNTQLAYLSANNNLLLNGFFLTLIVFVGFWIVKKIFLALF